MDTDGTDVYLNYYNDTVRSQLWTYDSNKNFVNTQYNKVLDSNGNGVVYLKPKTAANNYQRWTQYTVNFNSKTAYRFRNIQTDLVLDYNLAQYALGATNSFYTLDPNFIFV